MQNGTQQGKLVMYNETYANLWQRKQIVMSINGDMFNRYICWAFQFVQDKHSKYSQYSLVTDTQKFNASDSYAFVSKSLEIVQCI